MSEAVATFSKDNGRLPSRMRSTRLAGRLPSSVRPKLLSDVAVRSGTVRSTILPRTNYGLAYSPRSPRYPALAYKSDITITPHSPLTRAIDQAVESRAAQPVITNNSPRKQRSSKSNLKIKDLMPKALVSMALMIFIVGLYAGLAGLRASHVAQVQAATLTKYANAEASVANNPQTTTKTTSNPALATIKPSANTIADYVVAPNLPKYIIIPKLGVDARVLSVGVNAQGALGTPDNVYDTAWYNKSAEPGQQGAMLIDGHVSSWTAHGVFYGIKTLAAGNVIKIERGDGTIFTYVVVKSQVYPSGNVDMTSAVTPIVAGQPGLNLITCTGDVIAGTSQFNERIVVYATLQQ